MGIRFVILQEQKTETVHKFVKLTGKSGNMQKTEKRDTFLYPRRIPLLTQPPKDRNWYRKCTYPNILPNLQKVAKITGALPLE
jgi:hypothetical protein